MNIDLKCCNTYRLIPYKFQSHAAVLGMMIWLHFTVFSRRHLTRMRWDLSAASLPRFEGGVWPRVIPAANRARCRSTELHLSAFTGAVIMHAMHATGETYPPPNGVTSYDSRLSVVFVFVLSGSD